MNTPDNQEHPLGTASPSLDGTIPREPANLRCTVELLLPCGHVLKHSMLSVGNFENDGKIERGLQHHWEALTYWLINRKLRHDCALVSAENPNGVDRSRPSPVATTDGH